MKEEIKQAKKEVFDDFKHNMIFKLSECKHCNSNYKVLLELVEQHLKK